MARRGFSRQIVGDDGRRYQLPTAEYEVQTLAGVESVRGLAAQAAQATGKTFAVVVAECSRTAWVGLAYA
jgi:hypothetical protein